MASRPSMPGHGGHQAQGGDVDAIEHRRRPGIAAQSRHQGVEQGDEDEGGQEDADRGQDRPGHTGDEIADERRGREDRPGVNWPTATASSSC